MNKITGLSKIEIIKLIKESKSINAILKKLNTNSNGSGAYKTFKNHCKKLGVEIPKYENNGNHVIGVKIDLNTILVTGSTYSNISRLKKRLIDDKLLSYKCECGNKGEWLGKKLILQLDHKNGINNDNRLENLRFLCPNCHSQTETFGGKRLKKHRFRLKDNPEEYMKFLTKNRKVERPNYITLINEINRLGYASTGRQYGVSDNTIRGWIKFYEKHNTGLA